MNDCSECGFNLWIPLEGVLLEHSKAGLYNDARFPGRLIIVYKDHIADIPDASDQDFVNFMLEVKKISKVLKEATSASKINIAILGNAEPHLHAHIFPRFPENEPKPHSSPWDDTREKTKLTSTEIETLISKIENCFRNTE